MAAFILFLFILNCWKFASTKEFWVSEIGEETSDCSQNDKCSIGRAFSLADSFPNDDLVFNFDPGLYNVSKISLTIRQPSAVFRVSPEEKPYKTNKRLEGRGTEQDVTITAPKRVGGPLFSVVSKGSPWREIRVSFENLHFCNFLERVNGNVYGGGILDQDDDNVLPHFALEIFNTTFDNVLIGMSKPAFHFYANSSSIVIRDSKFVNVNPYGIMESEPNYVTKSFDAYTLTRNLSVSIENCIFNVSRQWYFGAHSDSHSYDGKVQGMIKGCKMVEMGVVDYYPFKFQGDFELDVRDNTFESTYGAFEIIGGVVSFQNNTFRNVDFDGHYAIIDVKSAVSFTSVGDVFEKNYWGRSPAMLRGGVVSMNSCNEVIFERTKFVENRMIHRGTITPTIAVVIAVGVSKFSMHEALFLNNNIEYYLFWIDESQSGAHMTSYNLSHVNITNNNCGKMIHVHDTAKSIRLSIEHSTFLGNNGTLMEDNSVVGSDVRITDTTFRNHNMTGQRCLLCIHSSAHLQGCKFYENNDEKFELSSLIMIDQIDAKYEGQIFETVIDGCKFVNNRVAWGGGVQYYAHRNTSLIIRDCKFEGNSAQIGGDVFLDIAHGYQSHVTIESTQFSNSVASDVGGSLYIDQGEAESDLNVSLAEDVTISGCHARYGGGIFFDVNSFGESKQSQFGAHVERNSADVAGGGVYFARKGFVDLSRSNRVKNNNAPNGKDIMGFPSYLRKLNPREDLYCVGNSVVGFSCEVHNLELLDKMHSHITKPSYHQANLRFRFEGLQQMEFVQKASIFSSTRYEMKINNVTIPKNKVYSCVVKVEGIEKSGLKLEFTFVDRIPKLSRFVLITVIVVLSIASIIFIGGCLALIIMVASARKHILELIYSKIIARKNYEELKAEIEAESKGNASIQQKK